MSKVIYKTDKEGNSSFLAITFKHEAELFNFISSKLGRNKKITKHPNGDYTGTDDNGNTIETFNKETAGLPNFFKSKK